jgi:XRE family aerobic/anaerobic benzoate catabolism transcriptional regulator
MKRVQAQGDLRPMAASREAMDDLKGILAGRAAFYSKADFGSTPARSRWSPPSALRQMVRGALHLPPEPRQNMHQSA